MNELETRKTMTVKEVSKILGVTTEAIKKWIRELYPNKIKNGIATILNEEEITAIKLKMRPTTKVVAAKTSLEKKLLIQQAMNFLNEEIEELKTENKQLNNTVNMLIHDNKTYTSTEIAKELNLKSAAALNKILEEKELQYKVNNSWVLTAKYSDLDYVSLKQQELDSGKIIYNRHWTGAGRKFILDLFNKKEVQQ